jgi:hypothetical protein
LPPAWARYIARQRTRVSQAAPRNLVGDTGLQLLRQVAAFLGEGVRIPPQSGPLPIRRASGPTPGIAHACGP